MIYYVYLSICFFDICLFIHADWLYANTSNMSRESSKGRSSTGVKGGRDPAWTQASSLMKFINGWSFGLFSGVSAVSFTEGFQLFPPAFSSVRLEAPLGFHRLGWGLRGGWVMLVRAGRGGGYSRWFLGWDVIWNFIYVFLMWYGDKFHNPWSLTRGVGVKVWCMSWCCFLK